MWRCLAEQESGHAFLQAHALLLPNLPEVVQYFDSLGSERRLELISQASDALFERLRGSSKVEDPFAQHRKLDGFWLFAGDGHYHNATVHDARVVNAAELIPKPALLPAEGRAMSRKREEPAGTKYAAGHFFALDLRTHLMRHLAAADQQERREEYDMRALKRLPLSELRMGAPSCQSRLRLKRRCLHMCSKRVSRHARAAQFALLLRIRLGELRRELRERSIHRPALGSRFFLRRHLARLHAVMHPHPFLQVIRIRRIENQAREIQAALFLLRIAALHTMRLHEILHRHGQFGGLKRPGHCNQQQRRER